MTEMNTTSEANPYMAMPAPQGIRMPGIHCRGENIPADPNNETWQAYLAFVESGGEPLPFDPALVWDGACWRIDPVKQAAWLDHARAQALQSIDQFHAETVQKLVGSPTQVEKDTWALKLEVANAIVRKLPIAATGQAFLESAGLASDSAKAEWAASVLAKSAAYAQVVGVAERLRDEARTAVRAASDDAALAAVIEAQHAAADDAIAQLRG